MEVKEARLWEVGITREEVEEVEVYVGRARSS
jgi:hypothetical protein